ncbi:hypothetical protein ABFS82_04G017100 [Erythranthe guttata]
MLYFQFTIKPDNLSSLYRLSACECRCVCARVSLCVRAMMILDFCREMILILSIFAVAEKPSRILVLRTRMGCDFGGIHISPVFFFGSNNSLVVCHLYRYYGSS